MSQARIPLCALGGLLLGAATLAAPAPAPKNNRALFQLWGKIRRPLAGEAKPIGSYAAGCLAGAEKLPLDGPGYSVMRPSRLRYFGHPDLVAFLKGLGQAAHDAHLPRLLVGDMGRPRGGPMPSGHSSHQIGLDVDVWLRMSKKRPSAKQRETWSAENFVKGEKELTSRWGDRERKLVELAASSPFVNRIFVHPAIKLDLCEKFPAAPWLYKMRPWWSHQDHMHVRLNCPSGAASCEPQAALDPKDPQCGKELAWWFTAEAKDEGAKKEAAFRGRAFPDLPQECGEMVRELRAGRK
jgi:penicillin-insensitive murein endopeptidase